MYLFRPSDQATSDPIDFFFRPNIQDVENMPIGIRYVKKADRKSHDKNKEPSKFISPFSLLIKDKLIVLFSFNFVFVAKKEDVKYSGGNVKVEKMESSGMSFTERSVVILLFSDSELLLFVEVNSSSYISS